MAARERDEGAVARGRFSLITRLSATPQAVVFVTSRGSRWRVGPLLSSAQGPPPGPGIPVPAWITWVPFISHTAIRFVVASF